MNYLINLKADPKVKPKVIGLIPTQDKIFERYAEVRFWICSVWVLIIYINMH